MKSDKMSTDFRGDPSSALLEVLDPEQNYMFVDHYLDVEYDLSQVFFIATANVLHTIPAALQDRMEVIRLSGYTEIEKLEIAKKFLVRKQMEATGLTDAQIQFNDDGLSAVIQGYTRESGVRNLEREVGNVARKVARKIVSKESKGKVLVNADKVVDLLGPAKYQLHDATDQAAMRSARRQAWHGPKWAARFFPRNAHPNAGREGQAHGDRQAGRRDAGIGAGCFQLRSFPRASTGSAADFYRNLDVHLHIPEGASPKDGPSAGITMATTICSALHEELVRGDIAMTG